MFTLMLSGPVALFDFRLDIYFLTIDVVISNSFSITSGVGVVSRSGSFGGSSFSTEEKKLFNISAFALLSVTLVSSFSRTSMVIVDFMKCRVQFQNRFRFSLD